MTKTECIASETSILKISELLIGNLMVLLAGCLGYLTGFLKAILGEANGQLQDGNKDVAQHYNGK